MGIARAAYGELVYGGHLLALGTSSMAATAAFVMGVVPTWDLLLMAYLFSFGAYAINRVSDFDEDRVSHPERTSYLEGRRKVLPAVAAGSFLLGYGLAAMRNAYFFGGLLVPLVLALAYSVGSRAMKGTLGISRLKDSLLVKNLAISFGWSLVPLLVGLYYLAFPTALLALAPFIFLRLMVNTIFFDERDVEADRTYGVRTLPVRFGVAWSSRLMTVLDVASAAYILLAAGLGAVPVLTAGLALMTAYSVAYRAYSSSGKHKDSMRDLAADGEYLLWGVVASIGHI